MNKEKTKREPLFHIAKRAPLPFWKSAMIRVIAVVLALIVCAIVCYVIGKGKVNPLELFSKLFEGNFETERKIWRTLKDIAVLLCISLAVTPAFKMRFWNIGAEGQVLVSCLASVACVYYLGSSLPNGVLLLCMLGAALLTGILWAVIPAIFKAKWNTNETLFTLMMNYIATSLVSFFLIIWTPDGSSSLKEFQIGQLPVVYNQYLLLVIIVALLTVGMYVYLKYSKQGYEISVVGESRKTACYIGISVKKVIVRTMIVSGALCGLAGFLIVSALDHSVTTNSVGGRGFTAIMVSWLGKFNPFMMVLTSFLIVFLEHGAQEVSSDYPTINSAFPSIITGIILFFIIGCEFFVNYKLVMRQKEESAK